MNTNLVRTFAGQLAAVFTLAWLLAALVWAEEVQVENGKSDPSTAAPVDITPQALNDESLAQVQPAPPPVTVAPSRPSPVRTSPRE